MEQKQAGLFFQIQALKWVFALCESGEGGRKGAYCAFAEVGCAREDMDVESFYGNDG
jgi:hypothetical protein